MRITKQQAIATAIKVLNGIDFPLDTIDNPNTQLIVAEESLTHEILPRL